MPFDQAGLEQFPKSVKWFSDKNCVEIQEREYFPENALAEINWGQSALNSLMRGRLLPARVTHLEMLEQFLKIGSHFSDKDCAKDKELEHLLRPSETKNALLSRMDEIAPPPQGAQFCITQIKNCPVHFYLYLYQRIGRQHHWGGRLKMREVDLSALLCSSETVLHLINIDGCPAGFCEMSLSNWPDVEIVYFGIMTEFQGHGWGRFFLEKMIAYGWSLKPERLTIQTNTLDSPHALKLYQAVGFHVTKVRDVMMDYVSQRGML